ncbi:MAG: hypothetical protein K2R98_20435 [Gemmataceae bacterium]|nr:hypothetical protein [Gemmataceae bacterium]
MSVAPCAEPVGTFPESSAEAPSVKDTGHDARGRFTRGNPGGTGNPFARRVASLRAALVDAVAEQDIRDIAMSLLRAAKDGNVAAAKLLFAYCIGKPAEMPDPDRLDVDEWNLVKEKSVPGRQMTTAVQRVPVQLASDFVVAALPGIHQGMAKMIGDGFKAMDAKQGQDNGPEEKVNPESRAENGTAPSTDGENGAERPSTNGPNGRTAPSTNGRIGGRRRLSRKERKARDERELMREFERMMKE